MASKALHHCRSLSLPSKSHPAVSQFNESLAILQASQPTPSSLSSMEKRLNTLRKLYINIDDLLTLPHIISEGRQEKRVDRVMDGYIQILDACSTAKDVFSQTKQDVQDLLSALRRKNIDGSQSYQTSRKKSKKTIRKCLKDLRRHNNLLLEKDDETMALVQMLKEVESVAIAVLESTLSYVMGSNVQGRLSGWSLVSKPVQKKKWLNEGEGADHLNEFKKVDFFLQTSRGDDAQLVNHLKEMELSIQVLEQEIERLFRQLIKTRVFLLNILNL